MKIIFLFLSILIPTGVNADELPLFPDFDFYGDFYDSKTNYVGSLLLQFYAVKDTQGRRRIFAQTREDSNRLKKGQSSHLFAGTLEDDVSFDSKELIELKSTLNSTKLRIGFSSEGIKGEYLTKDGDYNFSMPKSKPLPFTGDKRIINPQGENDITTPVDGALGSHFHMLTPLNDAGKPSRMFYVTSLASTMTQNNVVGDTRFSIVLNEVDAKQTFKGNPRYFYPLDPLQPVLTEELEEKRNRLSPLLVMTELGDPKNGSKDYIFIHSLSGGLRYTFYSTSGDTGPRASITGYHVKDLGCQKQFK